MVEVTVSDKHTSLYQNRINYSRKNIYDTGQGLFIICLSKFFFVKIEKKEFDQKLIRIFVSEFFFGGK